MGKLGAAVENIFGLPWFGLHFIGGSFSGLRGPGSGSPVMGLGGDFCFEVNGKLIELSAHQNLASQETLLAGNEKMEMGFVTGKALEGSLLAHVDLHLLCCGRQIELGRAVLLAQRG